MAPSGFDRLRFLFLCALRRILINRFADDADETGNDAKTDEDVQELIISPHTLHCSTLSMSRPCKELMAPLVRMVIDAHSPECLSR